MRAGGDKQNIRTKSAESHQKRENWNFITDFTTTFTGNIGQYSLEWEENDDGAILHSSGATITGDFPWNAKNMMMVQYLPLKVVMKSVTKFNLSSF